MVEIRFVVGLGSTACRSALSESGYGSIEVLLGEPVSQLASIHMPRSWGPVFLLPGSVTAPRLTESRLGQKHTACSRLVA